MKPLYELTLYDTITPQAYLQQLLQLYPYDIEKELVFSLLQEPMHHPSLLDFIDYARQVRKYVIHYGKETDGHLDALFTTMCKLSQRNQMVLHTHQFQFDASLHACFYHIPYPYAHLPWNAIPFIDEIHLHKPMSITMHSPHKSIPISYVHHFPYQHISMDAEDFFALSIQIVDRHGIVFLPRRHIGLLCACATLYQIEKPTKQHDFYLVYGLCAPTETMQMYWDATNEVAIGLVEGRDNFDHFSYVKDMINTLYHSLCLKKHDYPIRAAMVQVHMPSNDIGILLCGQEQSGKSELLDAFACLLQTHHIPYTKVFDDQGTLHNLDNDMYATGTEIGAYLHVDALPYVRIFDNLSASMILKEQNDVCALLLPFTTHEETSRFHKVDICIYLDTKTTAKGYTTLASPQESFPYFQQHFPFDTVEQENHRALSDTLLEQFLNTMFLNDIEVGVLHTHRHTHDSHIYQRLANVLYQRFIAQESAN